MITATPAAKKAPNVSAARTASATIKPIAQLGNEPVFDVASASRRFVEAATVEETDKADSTRVTNIEANSSNGKLKYKYE